MLKQLVNECLIDLVIIPEGPLLIKSGAATLKGPDMAFVRVWRNGQEEVYLPGSSLKGVLRSHAERIARTLNSDAACDPFAVDEPLTFCGNCFEKRKERERFKDKASGEINQLVYRDSCPICRLFGSTWYGSRLATADAYAVDKVPQPQARDGVGIDRFTGGAASGVKFDLEVVTEGRFATTLHLRNFELWQLGLVAFLLQDLKDGLLRIGAGRSRGLGKVRGEVQAVRLDYLGRNIPEAPEGHVPLCGVGALAGEEMARNYGMAQPDLEMVPLPTGATRTSGLGGIRSTYRFPDDSFPWAAVAPAWVDYASGYQTPPAMAKIRRAKEHPR